MGRARRLRLGVLGAVVASVWPAAPAWAETCATDTSLGHTACIGVDGGAVDGRLRNDNENHPSCGTFVLTLSAYSEPNHQGDDADRKYTEDQMQGCIDPGASWRVDFGRFRGSDFLCVHGYRLLEDGQRQLISGAACERR